MDIYSGLEVTNNNMPHAQEVGVGVTHVQRSYVAHTGTSATGYFMAMSVSIYSRD